MARTIPVASAQLVGVFLSSIFYGFYLISAWFCALALFRTSDGSRWRTKRELNWIVVVVAIFLFVNGTTNLSLGLYRVIAAFVYHYDEPGGAEGYLTKISSWINVVKTATLNAQVLVGDAVIIYRCYIVYGRAWKIIAVPVALWMGVLYATVRQSILDIKIQHQTTVANSKELFPYIIAFWVLTITQNILGTGLIVLRVWSVESALNASSGTSSGVRMFNHKRSPLMQVIIVIVESGLLITTIAFITFVNVLCRSNGLYVTSNTGVIIVGIAFNLIVIRSRSRPDAYNTTRHGAISSIAIAPFPTTRDPDDIETVDIPDHAIRVFVTQGVVEDYQQPVQNKEKDNPGDTSSNKYGMAI